MFRQLVGNSQFSHDVISFILHEFLFCNRSAWSSLTIDAHISGQRKLWHSISIILQTFDILHIHNFNLAFLFFSNLWLFEDQNVDINEQCLLIWLFLHCYFCIADSRGTVVMVGQDGVQRTPIHFPKGGHLLSFLSCMENGLLPHGQLDPPLWSHHGKGMQSSTV